MSIRINFLVTLALGTAAFADVQYEQSTRVTGGSLLNIPIVGGRLKEPHSTAHYIKGNKMAMVSKDQSTIYDLDQGNVTTINTAKRTYSVMTFEEMRAAMEESMKKMREMQESKNPDGNMTWNVSVTDAGDSGKVNGWDAHHYVITLTGEGTDAKTGQTGGMKLVIDSWNAKALPGIEESRDFHRRFAEKIGAGFATGMNPFVRAQLGSGWEAAAREMAKMEGVPVMSVMRMTSMSNGQEVMVPEGQQNRQGPSVSDAAKEGATGAVLGRLGGLGGFGGGGRKKKADQPPAADPNQKMVPATLMEFTTETTTYSTNSVDSSVFAVPAGFKQVEADMRRVR